MREFTLTVFDENISGSGPWYTSSQYNDPLGVADTFMVHAVTEQVSSTAPTLTVSTEHSCNGLDWLNVVNATVTGNLSNDGSYTFVHGGALTAYSPLSLVRLKASLSSTASCRLKLLVCGRTARA